MGIASDTLKKVYELLRRPSQLKLPYKTALSAFDRVASMYAVDKQLSEKNWGLEKIKVTPGTRREVTLALDNYITPSKIHARGINSTNAADWADVDVVNFDDLNRTVEDGRDAVAIYGSPPKIVFPRDVSALTYEIWYEPKGTEIAALTDESGIPDDFRAMLTYGTGVECALVVDDPSEEWEKFLARIVPYLMGERGRSEEKWQKWLRGTRRTGTSKKRPFRMGYGMDSVTGQYIGGRMYGG